MDGERSKAADGEAGLRKEIADGGKPCAKTVDYGKAEGKGPFPKGKRRRAARRDMQMVFRDPPASFSNHMDIGDAVWEGAAYKPEFSGSSKSERTRMVYDALGSAGLDRSFAKRRPFELSEGECQRPARLDGGQGRTERPEAVSGGEPTVGIGVARKQPRGGPALW